ncbi:ABC transporter permease, partial [Escherichia coli]
LYFVNIFGRRNRGDLFRQPYNACVFFVHSHLKSFKAT